MDHLLGRKCLKLANDVLSVSCSESYDNHVRMKPCKLISLDLGVFQLT